MKPEDIKVGRWYKVNKEENPLQTSIDSHVMAYTIVEGEVNYSVHGVLDFFPQYCSLEDFASCVQERVA